MEQNRDMLGVDMQQNRDMLGVDMQQNTDMLGVDMDQNRVCIVTTEVLCNKWLRLLVWSPTRICI